MALRLTATLMLLFNGTAAAAFALLYGARSRRRRGTGLFAGSTHLGARIRESGKRRRRSSHHHHGRHKSRHNQQSEALYRTIIKT